MPPGKVGGGFGDGASRRNARDLVPLMSQLAAQAGNGHWQWYVEQMGGPVETPGYVGFVRGGLPKVEPKPPTDLPTSRLFRGIGQAVLNTTLVNADDDVQVIFKSSPMGTRSHGNAANNSFVLWAYGQRLLIRTGHYYMYGGPHHRDWVWSTRSLNNITVNGQGQIKRSAAAKGEIVAFRTTPSIDVVVGEAAEAYGNSGSDEQSPFARSVHSGDPVRQAGTGDRLRSPRGQPASTFEYWLHAINEFQIDGQRNIKTQVGDVACEIDILAPDGTYAVADRPVRPEPVASDHDTRMAPDGHHASGAQTDRVRDALSPASQRRHGAPCRQPDASRRRLRARGRIVGRTRDRTAAHGRCGNLDCRRNDDHRRHRHPAI